MSIPFRVVDALKKVQTVVGYFYCERLSRIGINGARKRSEQSGPAAARFSGKGYFHGSFLSAISRKRNIIQEMRLFYSVKTLTLSQSTSFPVFVLMTFAHQDFIGV